MENSLDDRHCSGVRTGLFYSRSRGNILFVRKSKRMRERSVATDPMTDVSTWLKQTSVMVSVWFGHCIV